MKKSGEPKPFHFKQFSLFHHRSTMKVGTDAVLLSAWVDVNITDSILDVGTGSGIIALMVASRTRGGVDAIDIDPDSCEEAEDNFKRSAFSKQLSVFQKDLSVFAAQQVKKYDLIVSNPPFFINDLKSDNLQKNNARHTDSLSYNDLCGGTALLLKPNGRFCVVLPYAQSLIFVDAALTHGLFLNKKLLIFPKPCSQPNRVNLEFSFKKTTIVKEEKFIIRNENGDFTKQYVTLLGKYYLSIKHQ